MLDATTRLVVPRDVELIPISELEEAVREQLSAMPDAFAVHRPLGRVSPKALSPDLAGLFQQFTMPRTAPEAIVSYALTRGIDASEVVSDAIDALTELMVAGYLVDADGPAAAALTAAWREGENVGAFRVHSVVRVMEDVDVYQGIGADGLRVALKVWRVEGQEEATHEARTLHLLAGRLSPPCLAIGAGDPVVYLATQWCSGIDAETAAAELQQLRQPDRQRHLLALLASIATAYSDLHALGVLHGDVHGENILVDRDGVVRLLDFGQSTCVVGGVVWQPAHRGGYFRYFEPEYARARLDAADVPQATPASEQYALAAMLYHLYTGSHYLDFVAQESGALLQIVESPPLSFAIVGIEPLPELERILACALAKTPTDRYASMAVFSDALRELQARSSGPWPERASRHSPSVERLRHFWTEAAPGGRLFERGFVRAPTTSIAFGGAGLAYALYRYALLTGSSNWLSLAGHWSAVSRSQLRRRTAFHDGDELTPQVVGPHSVLNGAAGVHFVSALCANALGDEYTARASVSSFLRVTRAKTDNLDIVLGSAGSVLALSMLVDVFKANRWMNPAGLIARARRTARDIWVRLDACQPVGRDPDYPNLGISHGWAGFLYATLRLRRFGITEFDDQLRRRLRELADCAEYAGRGVRWAWRDVDAPPDRLYTGGWCNGSAGFAHLWLESRQLLGEAVGFELASAAAWNALDAADDNVPGLCCGLAGSAYAMLALHRASAEPGWLARSKELGRRAAAACSTDFPEYNSLFRGAAGVALLLAETQAPHTARMPLFESENWSDDG